MTKSAEAPRRTTKHSNSRFNRLLATGLTLTLGFGASACASVKADAGNSHSVYKGCEMPTGPQHAAAHTGPTKAKAIGKAMITACFGAAQWPSAKIMWTHESSWRATAVNPKGGACGIPQSYPCSKMTGATPLGKTTVEQQIYWGEHYIKDRYGTPDAAWDFWQKGSWYTVPLAPIGDQQPATSTTPQS